MTLIEFGLLCLVAAVSGAIGQALAGYSRGGLLAAIALGFVGALLGAWIAREAGLPELFVITIDSVKFPIVWSIIGSALFVALLAMIAKSNRSRN